MQPSPCSPLPLAKWTRQALPDGCDHIASNANARHLPRHIVTAIHGERSPRQRSGRKNSLISCASSSGCSSAAKCPPLGIFDQRRMSPYIFSPSERGGRTISLGNFV